MSRPIITEFETLIEATLSKTHLHDQDHHDLETELKQHLNDHYQELIRSGVPHEEAIKQTMDQFGNPKSIRKKINLQYPNTLRESIIKELLILLFLMAAIVIGPSILIRQYRLDSMLSLLPVPLLVLLIMILFRHFILDKFKSWKIMLTMTIFMYVLLMSSFISLYSGLPSNVIMSQLSFFNLSNYINGSVGLFTVNSIHLFWILILFIQLVKVKPRKNIRLNNLLASFQYWMMISLGLVIARFVPSNSEGQIVFINIFFISAVLEQLLFDRILAAISQLFSRVMHPDLQD